MTSEQSIQKQIMVALSNAGCTIFRNNVGAVTVDGRFIRYGVGGNGGSDLIGLTPCGKFLAVEVKNKKGRASKAQLDFIAHINSVGGIAGIARSVDDALNLLP